MSHTRLRRFLLSILAASCVAGFVLAWPARAKELAGALRVEGVVSASLPLDNKIDPALRFLVERYGATIAGNRGTRTGSSFASPLEVRGLCRLNFEADSPDPETRVFINVASDSTKVALASLGIHVVADLGSICVAEAPLSRIRAAAALDGVRSIELSKLSKSLLDVSRVQTGVATVQTGGGGLDRAYRGGGVAVGILDSGIDWSHPDFLNSAGKTRIRSLFDYAVAPNGREWTPTEIDAAQCTEIDGPGSGGHGTHVAGIAAGGGRRNAAYIGMAPDADIVFVKGIRDQNSEGGFDDADVLAGSQFIFNKARGLGESAVINLSLGGQLGPHDGTSLYEQALSSLVGPGRIIVAAAGNEGSQYIHGGYTATPGTGYTDAKETLWGVEQGAPGSLVDLWYPAPESVYVGVAVYAAGNYNTPLIYTIPPIAPGQYFTRLATAYGLISIDARTAADPNNGARHAMITVEDTTASGLNSNYVWSIYTFGSGTFDMWVAAGGFFAGPMGGLPSYFVPGDNNKSVGSPATAQKVIAVGSYVTKTSWVDARGNTEVQPGATLGAISTFSSLGPSRDGRMLPEVVAPGEEIISALSSAVTPDSTDILQGGGLQKLQGTSMAAPHVTGIVALMLEKNRYLTPENVLSLLESTATPTGAPNNTWGWGKVNAVAALLATPPSIGCSGSVPTSADLDCDEVHRLEGAQFAVWPNPTRGAMSIGFSLPSPQRVHLGIYDLSGRLIRQVTAGMQGPGVHQIVWDGKSSSGGPVANGVYFAKLTTPQARHVSRIVVLR